MINFAASVSKGAIIRVIEPDGTKTEWRVTEVMPDADGSVGFNAEKIKQPKTVVEEIWDALNRLQEDKSLIIYLLKMAIAEAVEWIESVVPGGSAQVSILAILKGEKTREIPKP